MFQVLSPVTETGTVPINTSSRYNRMVPVAEVVMFPPTALFKSVYVPVMVGQTVVGATTFATDEATLGAVQAVVEETVAV